MIEHFEPRCLLSGAVNVVRTDATFAIFGDSEANRIEVEFAMDGWGEPYKDLFVKGVDTDVYYNGQLQANRSLSLDYLGEQPRILMGDGDDYVEVRNTAGFIDYPFGSIEVITGGGNDFVGMSSGEYTGVYIGGGLGNDKVTLDGVNATSGVSVFTGPGRDRINIGKYSGTVAPVINKLWIHDNSGASRLNLDEIIVRRESVISTGHSADSLALRNCSFRRTVLIVTRAGLDVLDDETSVFRGPRDIQLGPQ